LNFWSIISAAIIYLWSTPMGFAQAISTTTAGMTTRTVALTFPGETSVDGSNDGAGTTKPEQISGLFLCERISSSSSINIEFGVNGCLQQGGLKTFMSILSVNLNLIYRPFRIMSSQTDDSAMKLSIQDKNEFYLIGVGGFSKITSSQRAETNLSVATDTLDFGGGVGYSLQISQNLKLVGEANYIIGSVMSSFASGSSSALQLGAGIRMTL
jgi:hypothetical protein